MQKDAGLKLKTLKVDGGAVTNNFLMQFQADILGVNVERPKVTETTALGAAYLAGLEVGFWNKDEIIHNAQLDTTFQPHMSAEKRDTLYKKWQKAVKRTMNWEK